MRTMKPIQTAAFAAAFVPALLPVVSGQYAFSKLIVGNEVTDDYEYVRPNVNQNLPVTNVTSIDMRCNLGDTAAQSNASQTTKTYEVTAGSTVGMALGAFSDNGTDSGAHTINLPGPLLVYLSRSPDGTDVSKYDGSGDWFKIHELGPKSIDSSNITWMTIGGSNFTWQIPAATPPGDYLMRTEHVDLSQAGSNGGAQFYIECAQLTVVSPDASPASGNGTADASSTPGPTVKIPGVYSTNDTPGIDIDIFNPVPTHYDMPGPLVWPVDDSNNSGGATNASSPDASSTSMSPPFPANNTAVASSQSEDADSTSPLSESSSSPSPTAPPSELSARGAPKPPKSVSKCTSTSQSTTSKTTTGATSSPKAPAPASELKFLEPCGNPSNSGPGPVKCKAPLTCATDKSKIWRCLEIDLGPEILRLAKRRARAAPVADAASDSSSKKKSPPKYAGFMKQCGGTGWKGPTKCEGDLLCTWKTAASSICEEGPLSWGTITWNPKSLGRRNVAPRQEARESLK